MTAKARHFTDICQCKVISLIKEINANPALQNLMSSPILFAKAQLIHRAIYTLPEKTRFAHSIDSYQPAQGSPDGRVSSCTLSLLQEPSHPLLVATALSILQLRPHATSDPNRCTVPRASPLYWFAQFLIMAMMGLRPEAGGMGSKCQQPRGRTHQLPWSLSLRDSPVTPLRRAHLRDQNQA